MLAEQTGAPRGARREIAALDGHRMESGGRQHGGRNQQIGDLACVSPLVVFRHNRFVGLEHLQVVPMDAQAAKFAQHARGRAPAAQRDQASAPLGARAADLGAQPFGGTFGGGLGSGENVDAHGAQSNQSCGFDGTISVASKGLSWPLRLRESGRRLSMNSVSVSLTAFVVAAGVLTITPGLDTALVLRTAVTGDSRSAALAGLGI